MAPRSKSPPRRATPARPALPVPAARRRFRRRLLEWYRAQRPRPALARDQRPVPHPRVRGDAAADAGRSRAAEVRRVAGEISEPDGAGRRPTKPTSPRPGGRSATTSGRGGCTRSRASRSRATAATLPSRRSDAAVVQGHRRVHRRRGHELRLRPARGDPRHQRRARALPDLRRPRRPEGARDEAPSLGGLAHRAAACATSSTSTRR